MRIRAEGVFKIFPPVIGFRVLALLAAAIALACAGGSIQPVSEAPPSARHAFFAREPSRLGIGHAFFAREPSRLGIGHASFAREPSRLGELRPRALPPRYRTRLLRPRAPSVSDTPPESPPASVSDTREPSRLGIGHASFPRALPPRFRTLRFCTRTSRSIRGL